MPSALKLFVLACACAATGGCALPYYWQAVGGQLALLRQREPIVEVLADSVVDRETLSRLKLVVDLRQFATSELGLPDNGSYTSYVELDRDYVVWNVIAAETFSVDPRQWCFPIAGCVSYRGYFDREAALEFEQKLASEGYDTYSGGSGAYSTLGYFEDPVLSTMLVGTTTNLAAVLFHELAHQRLYIKGDSELSEAFASAVEEYGVERWLESIDDRSGLADYRQRRERAQAFTALVALQRERLAAIYAQPLPRDELLALKTGAFAQMYDDYLVLKASWAGAADYDGWFAGSMNNARLAAITTYRQWLPGLRWRLDTVGLDDFYTEVEALAESPAEERTAVLDGWNAASGGRRSAQAR